MGKKAKSNIPRRWRKKLEEKRRAKRAVQESQDRLEQRALERESDKKRNIEVTRNHKEKMSDIITEFAEPLLRTAKTVEQKTVAISMAVAVWNLSFLPQKKHAAELKKFEGMFKSSGANVDLSKDLKNICNVLLLRKKMLFDHVYRIVEDYEFIDTPAGLHFNVVSIVLSDIEMERIKGT